jgi:hypothetical protein
VISIIEVNTDVAGCEVIMHKQFTTMPVYAK